MRDFRVLVARHQIVNQTLHRHIHLLSLRGELWAVCGVLILLPEEWERFRVICEVIEIEIRNEPPAVPPQAAETPATV